MSNSRLVCRPLAFSALVLLTVGGGLRAQVYEGGVPSPMPAIAPLEVNKSQRWPIFFPPVPPPLDARVEKKVEFESSSRAASPDLGSYAGEIYYPPLGTRLARNLYPAALRQRVRRHHADRDVLLAQLRAEILRVSGQDAAARIRALEALAARQAPQLTELEERAEQLRRDLTLSDSGWDDLREWFLDAPEARGFSPKATAAVMLGAAFYYPNLHPVQRALLREIAMELETADENTGLPTGPEANFVFFSPALARILPPAGASPAASESMAAYQTAKAKLKKELYDTISQQDKPGLNLLRGRAMRALADRQAPAIAALELAAEKVRRELPPAACPAAERTVLPVSLVERIAQWVQATAALREESLLKIQPLLTFDPAATIKYKLEPAKLEIEVVAPRNVISERKLKALDDLADAIMDDFYKRHELLEKEQAAILTAIGRAIGNEESAAISAAFTPALRAAEQGMLAAGYDDYRVAVFEPGLSPVQRRLLFAAAVGQLGLPLDEGKRQPVKRID